MATSGKSPVVFHADTDAVGSVSPLPSKQQQFAEALAHYSAGLIHITQRDDDKALNEWEQVIQLDPSRNDLRERVAQEYFRRNDLKKATEILEAGAAQDPDSASAWALLAIAYRSTKNTDKAVAAAEKAVSLESSCLPAYHVLTEIAVDQQKLDKARRYLDRATAQKNDSVLYWIHVADLYITISAREPKLDIKKTDILKLYEKALNLSPDNIEALERAANYSVMVQEMGKATEYYKKILELQPQITTVREKLALCHVADGKKEEAIQVLEEIVRREPLRYQIFTLIGQLYEDLKDNGKAQVNYQLSLSANPNQLPPYLRLALIELQNKNPQNAIKHLENANQRFPNNFQITYFYGLVYSETKDYPRAVEYLDRALKIAQNTKQDLMDSAFFFYYGAALERTNQFDKAVVQFEKSLALNPENADTCNYLGFMYADRNIKLNEAMRLVEKALSREPENGAFLDSMGWVYYRQGQLDKALLFLQRAAKLIHADAVIFDHLGDVYLKMGNTNEAFTSYQKAMELDPKNKDVKGKLDSIRLPSTPPSSQSTQGQPSKP